MGKLSADEREVILNYVDRERTWYIFSDSKTLRGTILKLAKALAAEVSPRGEGFEFTVPAGALRISARRKGRRPSEAFLNARPRGRKSAVKHSAAGGKVTIVATEALQ